MALPHSSNRSRSGPAGTTALPCETDAISSESASQASAALERSRNTSFKCEIGVEETASANCAGDTPPRSIASLIFSSLSSLTSSRLLFQWHSAYCSSPLPCVKGIRRIAGASSPSASMPTSRCSGSVRSLTMASSSAGPSSGSGAGKSVSQEDSTIARVMAKPAARPANPSVRARASTQIAATSRSRDRVRRMSRAWSRASAQMPRAAGQPPSDVSPSSALRSIRRASSRRSRRAERTARPSSLACRFSPLGLSPSSGVPKLVGSRSIESAMRLVSERGLEERSLQIYPGSGRRVDLAGRV